MKLRKIILNNLRSYEHQEVEFPDGSTLLSGDIGSGKTSILLAIEFALFGLQPGQRGSSLLRNGTDSGGASIEFEIEDKTILIERTLKRGKTISQDYCAITVDGEKKETSVTELKSQVLALLNYPREFSKKQNLLYKFTVYTPQEELKQIILEDSETRINTLRHVFGIDKYKAILENATIVAGKIREEKRLKEGQTSNLEEDKSLVLLKEEELETKKSNGKLLESELFLKQDARKKIEQEKEEISKRIEEKIKLQQEIEKSKIMKLNKQDAITENNRALEQLRIQINEISNLNLDLSILETLEKEREKKRNNLQELNEKNLAIASQISSLSLKNTENEIVKQKISKIEICPTCLQDVDPVYKSNIINKADLDTSQNASKIKELFLEKENLSKTLDKTNLEISEIETKIQETKILQVKIEGAREKQKRIDELEKTNRSTDKDVELLIQHIEILKNSVFELSKFDNLFEKKQKELESALNSEKETEIRAAELRREIDVFAVQINELQERIQKTEETKKQLEYLSNLENWLSKKFIPIISSVEKNVMAKLKTEFSKLFSEWFAMLVADSFNVRLDDDFTPIIEQQDYELDYSYLSGGERTAIALAYRLSLNQVINSLLSKIKTRDLVILDEPTDGFSEQQLDKMRDVLNELNVGQLIIVSHEQKIEGFVENVIKFKKEKGISRSE